MCLKNVLHITRVKIIIIIPNLINLPISVTTHNTFKLGKQSKRDEYSKVNIYQRLPRKFTEKLHFYQSHQPNRARYRNNLNHQ